VSDGAEQLTAEVILTHLFYLAGIALFARWLIRTSLGRKALVDSPPRRNRMAPYTPFIPFALWLFGTALLQVLVQPMIGPLKGWRSLFLNNLIFSGTALLTVVLVLVIARLDFARGLKGYGLRLRTMPKDLVYAFLSLLAVWPVVVAMIMVTMMIGRAIMGKQFEMPQHVGLELITESGSILLRVLIVFLAVIAAPLLEEMLFRGLIQTMLRSYTGRPWLGVIITSALFASVHANATHWPALFALAMGLGYTYERSGSLWRPIFMHALFNGITIAAVLAEQQGWI